MDHKTKLTLARLGLTVFAGYVYYLGWQSWQLMSHASVEIGAIGAALSMLLTSAGSLMLYIVVRSFRKQ